MPPPGEWAKLAELGALFMLSAALLYVHWQEHRSQWKLFTKLASTLLPGQPKRRRRRKKRKPKPGVKPTDGPPGATGST